jgi:hypothetical protein
MATYDESFKVIITSADGTKTHIVWELKCTGCLARHDIFESKAPITIECTRTLLIYLLDMMELSSSVKIKHLRGKMFEIIVNAKIYTFDNIPKLISRMCNRHIYWNISPEDANEIITRLGLSQYVFCVQGDLALGACLVVLQDFEYSVYQLTHEKKKEPRTIFREEYDKINQPRTVVMTPAQCDARLSKEIKPRVEFMSVLPDGRIEVVFRRDAIPTVVPEIRRLVEIDNLELKLKKLKSSLK